MNTGTDPDFDLRHWMRDVVILLGGRKDIADLLDKSSDGVTAEEADRVRNYACDLVDQTKGRLCELHKLKLSVAPPEPPSEFGTQSP